MSGESDENKEAPGNHAESETANQGGGSGPQLPPAIIPHDSPPPPASTEAPDKEPSKWRENTKLGLEIAGVVILICYTVFTYLQWHQIRRTNDLTQTALDGSKDSLGQTLLKMQGQTDATNRLYGEAQKQTAQATTLATNSGIQAGEAKVAAGAATSAAQTAKDALHISERAYVVTEEPQLGDKSFTVPLVNTGHKPSGKATTITHMGFYNFGNAEQMMPREHPTDSSWHSQKWDSILPGNHNSIGVPIPQMDQSKLNIGLQVVIVAGSISYNDGFEGTPQQIWRYCYQTVYQTVMKKSVIITCDPNVMIPALEKADGYPQNENP